MRFSIVNGQKKEAEKGLAGACIGCGQAMIPKCGPIKVKHWAHKAKCECDRWWENETEWHRTWKNNFPIEWQEVRQKASDGEWHIADVKTDKEWVIEFQHSFLKQEERHARNTFYGKKFVWVVDGLTRKNDRANFDLILKSSKQVLPNTPVLQIQSQISDCAILRDWSECSALVFFDFGPELPLWCLLPKSSQGRQYVLPVPRHQFVALHTNQMIGQDYYSFETYFESVIAAFENPQSIRTQVMSRPLPRRRTVGPSSAEMRSLYNYLTRPQAGSRRRFRF